MAREPIPTWFFVLTIVRKDDKFLLIHEKKHGQTWYLPAGRVEIRENLSDAAIRETLEESGVPIALEGVLRIEHTAMQTATRVSVIYVGHPIDDTPPISEANDHALEARWVTIEEASQLSLRSFGILDLFRELENGVAVHPLSVLVSVAL